MSTYTPIASVTLTSDQASVTFNSFSGYTDLRLIANVRLNRAVTEESLGLQFNSDTGSNYSWTNLAGNGASALSGRASNSNDIYLGEAAGTSNASGIYSTHIVEIQNYANTSTYKTVITRNNLASGGTRATVGLWRNTDGITSLTVRDYGGGAYNILTGSTFNLYGVANASITNTAKATGGDTITTDGTYWYHTFLSSGTFTPTEALTADYLVVAGGGGAGGSGVSGGGGAGGLRSTVTATGGGGSLESALSLTASTAYTVTVGAGGAAGATNTNGTNGTNSIFSTITSIGGGGGGRQSPYSGNTGGSGGGGYRTGTGGVGTTNQGYAGGNGDPSENSGGGGGAGAVGVAATSGGAGNGGNGVAVSITGTSVTYAGGGGGGAYYSGTRGTGGTGGGGAGAVLTTTNSVAGTANTGGGAGGGQGSDGTSKSGGSGIVIVRYAV